MKFDHTQFNDANGTSWEVNGCTMFVLASLDYMGRMFQRLVAVKHNNKFTWITKNFQK